jgi:hypothetical protein
MCINVTDSEAPVRHADADLEVLINKIKDVIAVLKV